MQTFAMQREGRYVGLALEPLESEYIVNEDQLKKLQPYIMKLIETSEEFSKNLLTPLLKEKLKIVAHNEKQAALELDGVEKAPEILDKIKEICKSCLTEKLIVPQYLGDNRPQIRHRVMVFEVEKNRMIVKYVTLGDFNNFDAAMKQVAEMYPVKK